MRRPGGRMRVLAALSCLVLPLAGCSAGTEEIERTAASQRSTAPAAGSAASPQAPGASAGADPTVSYAVANPGRLSAPLRPADLLVTSSKTIPASVRRQVQQVPGVSAATPLSLASVSVNGRTLSVAAADPGQIRRYAQYGTAVSDAVWKRVADGEVAVDPSLPRRLQSPRGYLRLGTSQTSPTVHIGAFAPLVKQIDAVVNPKRGRQLGLPVANALLVSTGELTPSAVTGRLKRVLGPGTTVATLALEFTVGALQTAVLSGGSVSAAVGTFSYTPHSDGSITPDPRWVSGYIRRETVPILGTVTCNKGMLPQLRGALTEVVQQGLAASIHPGEYAGCYVPRFIASNPANGLSLHSWGIAVDLNVPGNLRGTVGQMDRRVVAIFKKWGFAWGGDWSYTDPMHFEMNRVVTPAR